MGRKLLTGACLAVLALGLGGCDKDFCNASVEDPVSALFVGLLCSGVNTRENTAPTAKFTVTPTTIFSGETVQLDASASRDLGGIVKYEWDLDGLDGIFEVDARDDAVISRPLYLIGLSTETRSITLRVTDEDGAVGTASRRVTIQGAGPVARFTVTPNPVEVGQLARFDASSSTGAVTYSWDLDGNGTFEVGPTRESAINKTYGAPAAVNVRLRITDAVGLTAVATVRVIVIDASARATASVARGFSARLTRVRLPDDLGRARQRGAITTVRGVVVRGRLVAARRGLGALRPFRRARWRARLTMVARPARAKLTGIALARFPGAGEACLRIRMQTRRRGAPAGTIRVLGGRGPAARLHGGGRFRFTDLRPRGRLRARLGTPRPLPAACARLRR
jgi:PKD domain-containing protein